MAREVYSTRSDRLKLTPRSHSHRARMRRALNMWWIVLFYYDLRTKQKLSRWQALKAAKVNFHWWVWYGT